MDAQCTIIKLKILLESPKSNKLFSIYFYLQKLPFNADKLTEIFLSENSLRKLFVNDIYHNFMLSVPAPLNGKFIRSSSF